MPVTWVIGLSGPRNLNVGSAIHPSRAGFARQYRGEHQSHLGHRNIFLIAHARRSGVNAIQSVPSSSCVVSLGYARSCRATLCHQWSARTTSLWRTVLTMTAAAHAARPFVRVLRDEQQRKE